MSNNLRTIEVRKNENINIAHKISLCKVLVRKKYGLILVRKNNYSYLTGHVKSADLTWEYAQHPLNPLTWRLTTDSKMYVNRVEIAQMGHPKTHTFCAEDQAFLDGQPKRVVWKPECRENAPDPGYSFLGAVLNADPIGNAKFVIEQVNPLTANPLNGLAAIGNSVTGFTTSVQKMSEFMRRMDFF